MEQILRHTRGDTFVKTVLFQKAWVPINLTGSTVKFSIKDKYTDIEYIISQTATIPTPTNWKAEFSIPAATMQLDVKEYFYDIQITDSLWVVKTPIKGKFIITFDVT